jgi:glucose/arabinose dehydrogenase
VRKVVNGTVLQEPILDVAVATKDERGMLGIDDVHNIGYTYVFLYYTEARQGDGDDLEGKDPLGNRLYRYELVDGKLSNGKLLLDLPAKAASHHNGGRIAIGPDDYVYIVVGDLQYPGQTKLTHITTAQNIHNSLYPDGTGGILRVTQDGEPVGNILGGEYPLELYYAYGIRNSFGIDFDPITGNLWETENGEENYDELNIVEPGFNSGWAKVMGPISRNNLTAKESLVNFPGSKYADPVFSWRDQIGVTDIEFFNSSKLGKEYANNIFVGDINNGNLYYFKINENRTGIDFVREENENSYNDQEDIQAGLQQDLVADNKDELTEVKFGTDFGRITDIETGPDGFLYILSYEDGKVYRIVNRNSE